MRRCYIICHLIVIYVICDDVAFCSCLYDMGFSRIRETFHYYYHQRVWSSSNILSSFCRWPPIRGDEFYLLMFDRFLWRTIFDLGHLEFWLIMPSTKSLWSSLFMCLLNFGLRWLIRKIEWCLIMAGLLCLLCQAFFFQGQNSASWFGAPIEAWAVLCGLREVLRCYTVHYRWIIQLNGLLLTTIGSWRFHKVIKLLYFNWFHQEIWFPSIGYFQMFA